MENIMLQDDKKELIKIVDFGLSNMYDDDNPLKTQCGSPEYAAPELFVKGKKYGPEIDLWSLGVILYVMGVGRLPFSSPRDGQTSPDERRRRLMAQINRGLSGIQERAIAELSPEYRQLIGRLLTPAAHRRIRIQELCHHPWIADGRRKLQEQRLKWNEEEDRLERADHSTVIEELVGYVDMSRRKVEMDIMNKRFGKVGGMYNIIAHEIERIGSNRTFKAQHSLMFRPTKQSLNQSYQNMSSCRNKMLQSPFTETETSTKAKAKDSFTIAEYDRSSKKTVQPVPVHNRLVTKEVSGIASCMQRPGKKLPTKFKRTDDRPKTLPCTKPVLPTVGNVQSNSRGRPYSEQPPNRLRPITRLQLQNRKTPSHEKSIVRSSTAQGPTSRHPSGIQQRMPVSRQSRAGATSAAASMGQGDDRRSATLRRSERGRIDGPEARDKAVELVTRSQRDRETNSAKMCLKKSRSIMKSLDKFKWRNYIFHQERHENSEKKKNTKTKTEAHNKKNNPFTSILKDFSKIPVARVKMY